jgi:hypothetical protein
MKTYVLSFADSITHVPAHPERTATRMGRGLDFDVTYRVWPNRDAMLKLLDRQGSDHAPRNGDWRAVTNRPLNRRTPQ